MEAFLIKMKNDDESKDGGTKMEWVVGWNEME